MRRGKFEKEKRKGGKIREMGNGIDNVRKSRKLKVKKHPHGFTTWNPSMKPVSVKSLLLRQFTKTEE